MSNDLLLGDDHDLIVRNNDLVIITDAERVRQNIEIKLKLWRGEWFLDEEFGTPYMESILGKQVTLVGAVAAIKASILEVSDVNSITEFSYNFIRSERRLAVEFTADTSYCLITVSA